MNSIFGWPLLLVITGVAGIAWILSVKLDAHEEKTTKFLHDSNERILARLGQLADLQRQEPEGLAAVVLERSEEPWLPQARQGGAVPNDSRLEPDLRQKNALGAG